MRSEYSDYNYRTTRPSTAIKANARTNIGPFIEKVVNDEISTRGHAHAHGPAKKQGSYKKKCCSGSYAEVTTGEAAAEWTIFSARANGPRATAGQHDGVYKAVHANLELARAEAAAGPIKAGVGLSANTGASIGPDGVEASILGFGASFGPQISVRTPVADASCVVM